VKILLTGKGGNSGSFAIRGTQLGAAIGATIEPMASLESCKAADIIIVVKRTPTQVIENIRQSGKPWVFDVVDGWPQPSEMDQVQAMDWLQNKLESLKPNAVVFGTQRMQFDSGFEGPSLVLPHHSWSKYQPSEIREKVSVVGYEGAPAYLGKWFYVISDACAKMGWDFIVNGDMTKADIGIALRQTGGYPAKYWKPGTKLSNLHALGIPALCTQEAGYQSVASGMEFWIHNEKDVTNAFDNLADVKARKEINKSMLKAAITLESVADKYKAWLKALV
jgi:hypothetical protein